MTVLVIFSRWLHLVSACLMVGAAFFMYVVVPWATRGVDPEIARTVFLRLRRGFKLTVHPSILFFLITGTYNAYVNWPAYRGNMPLTHALFGLHLLLGLVVFGILLVILVGREPGRRHRAMLGASVALLLITVAVASSLKWAREHPKPKAVE